MTGGWNAQAARLRRLEDDLGRDGTLAPERRAFESPIAMACLRFLCSPFFRWRISVSTIFCAFGPYLRPELFLREEDDLPREELRVFEDDLPDLAAISLLPCARDGVRLRNMHLNLERRY
jgi:hypothetical protein